MRFFFTTLCRKRSNSMCLLPPTNVQDVYVDEIMALLLRM
jgi:hypothetical protein